MKKRLAGFILFLLPLSTIADARDPGLIAFEQHDYTSALSKWAPQAAEGDMDAQFNLGYLYENGLGTTRNIKAAKHWYALSARQGSAVAQHSLATLHHDSKEYVTAVNWYTLSAEQGLAEAQADLGASYGLGQGVPQNYIYAHMWSNISSLNGFDMGVRLTAGLAKLMSPKEISVAQYLARECIANNYQGCLSLSYSNVLLAIK